jgi:hypothetical protein
MLSVLSLYRAALYFLCPEAQAHYMESLGLPMEFSLQLPLYSLQFMGLSCSHCLLEPSYSKETGGFVFCYNS